MCGIAFQISNKPINSILFQSSLEKMIHRGPDSNNCVYYDNNIALGHTRLSIIDTSNRANQPFFDENSGLVIVFNGEIYNFKEIKSKLKLQGLQFKTNSDTEVILKGYHLWGEKVLHHLEGMFSFVIYDRRRELFFIARDRFGVKPLYYYHFQKELIISSEIKFIKSMVNNLTVDESSKYNYFKTGYVPAQSSIYNEIKNFPSGHYGIFERNNNNLTKHEYWNPVRVFKRNRVSLDFEEVKEVVRQHLISSINQRMVSDVPVGVFLSGGIDSTLLVSILKKELNYNFKTFTIGFDDIADESKIAKTTTNYLGLENISKIVTYNDFKNQFEQQYNYFDEPFSDSSAPLFMELTQLARQYVKVSLSADGGDEFFGGYSKYLSNQGKVKYLKKLSFGKKSWYKKMLTYTIKELVENMKYDTAIKVEHINNIACQRNKLFKSISKIETVFFTDYELENYIKNIDSSQDYMRDSRFESNNFYGVEDMLTHDILHYMQGDILKKVDNATMSKSLEGREPFLDHKLFEFLGTISPEIKFDKRVNKYLLREVLYDYIDKEIVDRPKSGFGAPLVSWSNNIVNDYRELIFDYREIIGISEDYIHRLFSDIGNNRSTTDRLWIIVNYLKWFDHNRTIL